MKKEYLKKLKSIAQLPTQDRPIALGALLSKFFYQKGITLTIVGGAAVQFYTQAEYVTKDLDAILTWDTKEIIEEVMNTLGFKRTSMYRHFESSLFDFVVEFPPSPIEIGSREITKVAKVKTQEGFVEVIRLEDIIMDRIIAGVEWKDEPSLDQAKLLWLKNKELIDQKYLKQFAKEEGCADILKQILKL